MKCREDRKAIVLVVVVVFIGQQQEEWFGVLCIDSEDKKWKFRSLRGKVL